MRGPLFALAVAAAMLSSLPVQAHHSFGGTYDVDETNHDQGKDRPGLAALAALVPVRRGRGRHGSVQRWVLEGAGATQFAQQGINKDAFKIGDPVEVVANPSRSPNSTRGRLIKITRTTDGKSWGTRVGETVD